MKRRILAILLAAIMVLSAVPFSVFAEDATVVCPGKGEIHTADNCESEWFADVAPVCNKPGYSVYTCLGCGDQYIVITKEASNTPHNLVKATKAATCTETGIKEDRWQCIACKDYFTDANGENVTTDYETPALGHDHQAVEGDCTIVKCSRCGHTQQAETNGSHDGAHNYKVIKFHTPAATCKDTAKADVKCTVCGHEKHNVDVASDVPHDFKAAVTAQAATCTERGYKAHKQCKVCNRYFTPDGATELFANPTTNAQKANALYIAALGHNLEHADTIKISVTYPKCDVDGYATYECGVCHQKVEGEKIPATPSYFFYIKIKSNGKFVMDGDNKKVFVTAVVNTGDVLAGSEYDFVTTDGDAATHEKVYITEEDGSKKINHKFNFAADTVTAPTCTEYGYTKRLCLDCGKLVSSEKKDPIGHTSYVYGSKAFKDDLTAGKIVITKAPTCSKGGLYTYDCKNGCGETDLVGYIAPLGHKAAKTVTTANCTVAGVTFTYAPVNNGDNGDCDCGNYTLMTTYQFVKQDGTNDGDPWTLWDPSTIVIDAVSGDLYIPEVDGVSSAIAGFLVPKSSTITKAAKNSTHIERTQVVNKPTCDTKGSGVKLCIFCGANESYEIPANGHKFELTWAKGTAANKKTLKNSLEYKAAIAAGFTATATNKGVIGATCTVGSYLSIKCKNCSVFSGETDKDINNVSFKLTNSLGHDVRTKTVYPTCDGTIAVGYTYTYCDRGCWNYHDDTEENRAHWTNLTTYQEKTSYTEDEVLGYHPHLFDVYTKQENPEKAGQFKYFVEVYKTGDCTKVGLDKFACPDCGRNILVIQGETGSHLKPSVYDRDPSNYKAQQNATCCKDGKTEWYVCQRCDAEIGGATITKDCHYVLVIAGKAPSCNANGTVTYGYKAIYTCDADNCCNKNKFFEYKVVGTEDGEDVYGYVQLAGITRAMVYKKNADGSWSNTLKDANVLANMALDKVTKTIKDNKASNVFAADNVRLGDDINDGDIHNFENKDGKAANCTENGYTPYQQCKVCGYISGKTTLYAPVHDYDKQVNYEATCLAYGYSVKTCKICNYVKVTNFKAPLGHDLAGVAETTVNATCTQPGYKYKTCQRAGCPEPRVLTSAITYVPHKNAAGKELGVVDKAAFEAAIKTGVEVKNSITTICTAGMSEEDRTCACGWIAAAEHHLEKTTVVAPTCTTDGYTVVTCGTCKAVLSTTVVTDSKTGHNWDAGVVVEEATEISSGTMLYTCTTCGATYTDNIPVDATVYLDLTYANANGKEGFAESSLITVKVVLSSLKASIRTLNYDLDYDQAKLEFVSATGTNLFAISSINDVKDDSGNSTGIIKFAGMSPNAVDVADAIEIATITFRSKGDATQTEAVEAIFDFVAAEAYLGTGDIVHVNTDLENNSIEIVKLMNVYTGTETTPDTDIDMQDALAIYDIIQAKGYNVAADLDKNGAVDAYDLQLFYNYFVGSMKAADIFAAN